MNKGLVTALLVASASFAAAPLALALANTNVRAPAAHTEMPVEMAMEMTAPPKSELEFIRAMIPHHQEAIDSAAVVAQTSERPKLRAFAREVVRVQTRELKTLQAWLGARRPDDAAPPYRPMMRRLPDATPDEADRAFAEDMVTHHQMALTMAEQFLAGDFAKRPEVVALARDIITTQSAEIRTLRSWLRR